MPTVTLKVRAEQRELWVSAAGSEGVTLSEWLRRAAAARLGTEEAAKAIAPGTRTSETPPASSAEAEEPASVSAKISEARELLDRPFRGPDLKPSQQKKR